VPLQGDLSVERVCQFNWRDRLDETNPPPARTRELIMRKQILKPKRLLANNAELSRKLDSVVATLHSFNDLSSKLVAVPVPFLSFHFAAPFPQSVHDETASLQRFIPSRDNKTDGMSKWITNGMVRRFYVASDLCMRGLRRRRPMELHTIGIDLA
jgi:hypothetical protein